MHVHIGHIVQNALYFFTKISSLLLGRDRTKFSVMMNKVYIVHVSMKIVNFRTPWVRVWPYWSSKFHDPWGQDSCARVWPIQSLKLSKKIAVWSRMQRSWWFRTQVNVHSLHLMQVSFQAHGPLVYFMSCAWHKILGLSESNWVHMHLPTKSNKSNLVIYKDIYYFCKN